MTGYYIKVRSATGREFIRVFASMTQRELFKWDAAKLGAVAVDEWTGEL